MDLEIEFGEYLKQMRGSKSLDQVSAETGLDCLLYTSSLYAAALSTKREQ